MRVADDLARWGYEWTRASTDRGNEFVSHRFTRQLEELGVEHRYIKPGRAQSNGKVEQVQNTILQECWKPALIGYVEPSITGLRADLEAFLDYYNTRRPHHGRWNQGDPPRHHHRQHRKPAMTVGPIAQPDTLRGADRLETPAVGARLSDVSERSGSSKECPHNHLATCRPYCVASGHKVPTVPADR